MRPASTIVLALSSALCAAAADPPSPSDRHLSRRAPPRNNFGLTVIGYQRLDAKIAKRFPQKHGEKAAVNEGPANAYLSLLRPGPLGMAAYLTGSADDLDDGGDNKNDDNDDNDDDAAGKPARPWYCKMSASAVAVQSRAKCLVPREDFAVVTSARANERPVLDYIRQQLRGRPDLDADAAATMRLGQTGGHGRGSGRSRLVLAVPRALLDVSLRVQMICGPKRKDVSYDAVDYRQDQIWTQNLVGRATNQPVAAAAA